MRIVDECPKGCGAELVWISRGGLKLPKTGIWPDRPQVCPGCGKKLTARTWKRVARRRQVEARAIVAGLPVEEYRHQRRLEAAWQKSALNPWTHVPRMPETPVMAMSGRDLEVLFHALRGRGDSFGLAGDPELCALLQTHYGKGK